jgi:ribonuclease HI
MAKQKYYVVWKGQKPGIYSSWAECEKQIKGFVGALYKSFEDIKEAEKAYISKPHLFMGKPKSTINSLISVGKPIIPSISVDAACAGNPGLMEYRGVDTESKKQLFHNGPYKHGTNNIGEFLAIVHGLAMLKKHNSNLPIYTDSITALSWIKEKKARTKLEQTPQNQELFELIQRAEYWLNNNSWPNTLLKWETEIWGEIPADFGRK